MIQQLRIYEIFEKKDRLLVPVDYSSSFSLLH